VGLVKFMGKQKTIEVFTPLGESSAPCPAWLEGYHKAIGLYRKREFREAHTAFEAAKAQIGGEDRLCEMYMARCKSCVSEAPRADWDGAWTLTEK
jgi:adenylate cyclase